MKQAKYLTMLDSFAANLAGLASDEDQLQQTRRTVQHLRAELQAVEVQELRAKGIPAQPVSGGIQTTGQQQALLKLYRQLESVVEHFRRGYPLYLRNSWEDSARHYQAAQTELPTAVILRLLVNISSKVERYEEALALCDQAENLASQRNLEWIADLVLLRSYCLGKLERYNEALAEVERSVALQVDRNLPPNPDAALHRGSEDVGRQDERARRSQDSGDELEKLDGCAVAAERAETGFAQA